MINVDKVFQYKYPGVKVNWHFNEDGEVIIDSWTGIVTPEPNAAQIADDIEEYEATLDYKVSQFNVDLFSQDLLVRFKAGEFTNPSIRFEYGALKEMASRKSVGGFESMKDYIEGLVTAGLYQQQDYDTINNSCKSQDVDLDDF